MTGTISTDGINEISERVGQVSKAVGSIKIVDCGVGIVASSVFGVRDDSEKVQNSESNESKGLDGFLQETHTISGILDPFFRHKDIHTYAL